MIVPARKLLGRLKFVVLFLLMTYMVTHIFSFINEWISPVDKYREPRGKAVKVFHSAENMNLETRSFMERLRLFYWLGE